MFKSILLVSFCFVSAFAEPILNLQNDSPLTRSLSSCDVQSIKYLVDQLVSLTSETVNNVWTSAVAVVQDLAFCLWPLDLYMCLEGDMEYAILNNIKYIGASLERYANTLQPLLKDIADDLVACASV